MIEKYVFGNPFPTHAVTEDVRFLGSEAKLFEHGIKFGKDGAGCLTMELAPDEIVYGLGEQVRGINKRGWRYVSWNTDNPNHQEDTTSLYGAHNFLLLSGEKRAVNENAGTRPLGLFVDYGGRVEFDIGYTSRELMTVTVEGDYILYVITGETPEDIVRQFRRIIGQSYIPPEWAFGYAQSRWGYKDEADIRRVADNYERAGIPLSAIYLDIDYMDAYKDFTIDSNRFPDMRKLVSEMKARGIQLVPIIDAGIKIEDGYDVFEEGRERGYFVKNADGSDFTGAVWPGRVHFPDFLNSEARSWFGRKYEFLTSLGIEGFWNDMNEPAIFYTEKRLADTVDAMIKLSDTNMGIEEYFGFTAMANSLSNNNEDYSSFFHNGDGISVNHKTVHNLYGMNMMRAASEALREIEPDKRILLFSRSSYVGAHRYGGIWQGDNKSWWSHILQSMQQLPALNMCGFLFIGSDTGGFGSDTTEDLMIRWLQYSLFTPLMRNHSALGTREQELYLFSSKEIMREMVRIRYALIPYLYSLLIKCAENDEMMFRPLGFEFPEDADALNTEDQLLVGKELMIAPVYRQNARGRYVYLPEDMTLIRMKSPEKYETSLMTCGHHYVHAALDELVFFLRQGCQIPFGSEKLP